MRSQAQRGRHLRPGRSAERAPFVTGDQAIEVLENLIGQFINSKAEQAGSSDGSASDGSDAGKAAAPAPAPAPAKSSKQGASQ